MPNPKPKKATKKSGAKKAPAVSPGRIEARVGRVEEDVATLRAELSAVSDALTQARRERDEAVNRAGALWEQSRMLWKLHVASSRLHDAITLAELHDVIVEIVAAIIGSEQLVIFERGERDGVYEAAAVIGLEGFPLKRVQKGTGIIGRVLSTGETWVAEEGGAKVQGEEELTACIPLRFGPDVLGAIGIFQLLPQKAGLDKDDHQLFQLLRTQAATALYCARARNVATA